MIRNPRSQFSDYPWAKKVQRYIASGNKGRALTLLGKIVEFDMPLFPDDSSFEADRRYAWLYRIDLLREWGRHMEAFAWTC
jgi:hypothetical protein